MNKYIILNNKKMKSDKKPNEKDKKAGAKGADKNKKG
jgi:hypothetical protein